MPYEWNDQDLKEIRARGITPEKVAAYIEQFQQGFPAIQLDRPCTVGDGITTLLDGQDRLATLHAAARPAQVLATPFGHEHHRIFAFPVRACGLGSRGRS